jgi:hypothetical protein
MNFGHLMNTTLTMEKVVGEDTRQALSLAPSAPEKIALESILGLACLSPALQTTRGWPVKEISMDAAIGHIVGSWLRTFAVAHWPVASITALSHLMFGILKQPMMLDGCPECLMVKAALE